MVLKWIVGSKVDHPLADPKEAKALVSELPSHDYLKALEEITRWLESLAEAEGFKLERLFEIAELLDSTAQPHHRRLVHRRNSGSPAHPSRARCTRSIQQPTDRPGAFSPTCRLAPT